MVTLRLIEEADREQVTALAKQMHAESKYAHVAYNDDKVQWFIDKLVDGNGMVGYVATCDKTGDLVGGIAASIYSYHFNPSIYMMEEMFIVKPSYRMTSLPLKLITVLERHAQAIGCDAVVVGASAPQDVRRVGRFYRKIGYAPWGITMRKELKT